jgi:hypothetical protein
MTKEELRENIAKVIHDGLQNDLSGSQLAEEIMDIAVGERVGKAGGTDPVTLAEKVCNE